MGGTRSDPADDGAAAVGGGRVSDAAHELRVRQLLEAALAELGNRRLDKTGPRDRGRD